jgi:hypothetical protein
LSVLLLTIVLSVLLLLAIALSVLLLAIVLSVLLRFMASGLCDKVCHWLRWFSPTIKLSARI